MGVVINFPNSGPEYRFIVLSDKGDILLDELLYRYDIKKRLNNLHILDEDNKIFHIKVVKDEHIILNKIFVPFESDENKIIQKLITC